MVKKLIIFALISVIVTSFNLTSRGQSQSLSKPSAPNDKEIVKNLLERAGERIQKYQDAMFSIAFTEILQQQELRARSAGPGFYKEGAEAIRTVLARLDALDSLLVSAYARWNDLDSV